MDVTFFCNLQDMSPKVFACNAHHRYQSCRWFAKPCGRVAPEDSLMESVLELESDYVDVQHLRSILDVSSCLAIGERVFVIHRQNPHAIISDQLQQGVGAVPTAAYGHNTIVLTARSSARAQESQKLTLTFVFQLLIRAAVITNPILAKHDIGGCFRQNTFAASLHLLMFLMLREESPDPGVNGRIPEANLKMPSTSPDAHASEIDDRFA